MTVPTPEQGLRERIDLETEKLRSKNGDFYTRFALTFLHPNLDKRQVRFGIWNKPDISLVNPFYFVVSQPYLGRLDKIASDYYNDPRLWWAIAITNNIKNPLIDMETGMTLVIPQKEAILEALETGSRFDFG